jgi:acetolactate synthase-1/2/3 large subunit
MAAVTTTADDTLKQKNRDGQVISGGRLVAKALKNEGVDTIFTLCGGHIIDIYDGCVDEGIRIIDVRHEQVAAHAADGHSRQTGKLGCVVTTAGPGCTNAVTGIATASARKARSCISAARVRCHSTRWARCRICRMSI